MKSKNTDMIDTITCDCGLKFSSMKYYKEHMSDVKEAVRLLQYRHKIKSVTYIQKQTKVKQ